MVIKRRLSMVAVRPDDAFLLFHPSVGLKGSTGKREATFYHRYSAKLARP